MKIFAILIAIGICFGFVPTAFAGEETDTITVNMTPAGTADIEVYNATSAVESQAIWNPTAKVGDGKASTSATFYNMTNVGTCNVSVTVQASNTADWTLSGTAALDAFVLETDSPDVELTTSPQPFVSDLPTSAGTPTEQFGLSVTMPTFSSTNDPQQSTITFVATAL